MRKSDEQKCKIGHIDISGLNIGNVENFRKISKSRGNKRIINGLQMELSTCYIKCLMMITSVP